MGWTTGRYAKEDKEPKVKSPDIPGQRSLNKKDDDVAATPKKEEDKPKKQSFNSAFAAARKAGKESFNWNGKTYTTELDSEVSKPMPTGDIGKREMFEEGETAPAFKKGGKVSSASKRADGCAVRGKTRA